MDDLINFGANFDWITPAWAILQDIANRPISRFGIQFTYFSRGDIRAILRNGGVKSWGYIYNVAGDMIMISVPRAEAARAYNLMIGAGLTVLYAPKEAVYN